MDGIDNDIYTDIPVDYFIMYMNEDEFVLLINHFFKKSG